LWKSFIKTGRYVVVGGLSRREKSERRSCGMAGSIHRQNPAQQPNYDRSQAEKKNKKKKKTKGKPRLFSRQKRTRKTKPTGPGELCEVPENVTFSPTTSVLIPRIFPLLLSPLILPLLLNQLFTSV
jgi:hypothetical protein